MPNDKMYKFGVGIDQKSLDNAKKQLGQLAESFEKTMQEIESKGLNASNRSKAKSELMSIMKLTEKQAVAVQDMMNGVIPSDEKQLNALKQNVQNVSAFISDAMQRMAKVGASVDWMKNGTSFVDTFTHMKSTLETTVGTIDELKTSISTLTQSFSVLKDAFATMHPEAFGKRFGAEVRATTEEIKKAQAIIDNLQAQEHKGIKSAFKIKKDDSLFDYTGYDVNEIRQSHAEIQDEIRQHLSTIAKIESQYAGREKSLYANADYKEAVHGLFVELENFKSLKNVGSFEDAFAHVGSEAADSIKGVTVDIKNATDNAVKQIKDALSGIEGIELSIKLPDADAPKFVSQVDDFVKKTSKHFKTKPISVFAEIKNPFKETTTPDGAASNDIADRFTESLKSVKEAVNTGYKELTTLVNNDNSTLKNALTLKFDYRKSVNDGVITDALADMQSTIYESAPLNLAFETEKVAEKLAANIQKALKDIELPTFTVPTFTTDHFSGGAIPVQIVGTMPALQAQEFAQNSQQKSGASMKVPPASKQPPKKTQTVDNDKINKPAAQLPEDIGVLRITSALHKLLQGMSDAMQTQQDIVARETANIKAHNDNLEAHASDIQAARKRNEIIDKRLEKPNARKDKIQAEQKIIVGKLQETRDAYNVKYQELFAGDEYKKIRGLDDGFAMLQENLQETQQEYIDKLKSINKKIEETRAKIDKSTSEDERTSLSRTINDLEAKRSKIDDEYTEKLSKFESSIAKNRAAYAEELDKNVDAKRIDSELQPLRTAINNVAAQLQAKKEELDAVVDEIKKIKVEVRSEHLNKQLADPTERKNKLQEESGALTEQHTQARDAYDAKHKELLATANGATVDVLDKAYETLQNNYNRIKAEYERKIQQINDNITAIQKRSGTSAVVDKQIPELIKAQEAKRAEVEAQYAAALAKIEADIKINRDSHTTALQNDDNASRIYGELQSLKNAASGLADKLVAKKKELDVVLNEIKAIKQGFQDGEDLLGDDNPREQIEASTKKVAKAQQESSKIYKRTQMVQAILKEGENPSKYVLDTTNEFWSATKKSIATAEKSMMKRVTSDAMKDGVTQLFNQIFSAQNNLAKISDQDSSEYKLAKAHLDGLMNRITNDTMQNYLTQFLSEKKKLSALDPQSADYKNVQTNISSLIQQATNNMVETTKNNLQQLSSEQKKIESLDPQSEDYNNTKKIINELWVKISEAAKALTGQDAKAFNNMVSRFKNAYDAREGMSLLGLNDMSELAHEEAIRIVSGLLSKHRLTSESVANLGQSYHLDDLSDYVGIAKTAMGVEDKTFAQYDKDIQAENTLIQIARNMAMLKQLYQSFPKDNELPDASTISKFIQFFGGFSEMGDVVESAAKYLSALQNINALKEDVPLLKTLDDNGILGVQLPKLFKTIYGNLGDDDKKKLSSVASGYGLKDVDITKLDGDALSEAFAKMSTAFANNAFKDLDIQSPVFKQIEKLLSYNASVISAQKDLQDAVNHRRNYLQSATYTTQGRSGGPARTKTDNVYDALQSNAPLNVRVVNDTDDYVASIYSPKGTPGEADRKYKANPSGFSNFAFEAGIKNEINAIVAASLKETLLSNVSSMLTSWVDGYTPTASEIFQLSSALPDEFKPGDYIDEDGVVIELDELRKYVQKQKEDMVTASQLMRQLVESGRIQVSLGKNSITPNYAKKDDNYSESALAEQIEKEKQLERDIEALRNKNYSSLDKITRARITGDYSNIDDITKARITGDYSALSAADQKKANELGALMPLNVDDFIADMQAKLDSLRKIRISTEKEIDAIIAIEDDLQARKAKIDKITEEKNAEESKAKMLDRYGEKAFEYNTDTAQAKSKYTNKIASVDELLDNIAFAKSYGIGDVSKLEKTVEAYRKAIANKDDLEESDASEEDLVAAVKEVDAAEQALIEQYFSNGHWKVISHLQQQFANAKLKREAGMRDLQGQLDAAESAQTKTESEINNLHIANVKSINEAQMSLSNRYLETPELDLRAQNREYENAVAKKRKEIEKQKAELWNQADADPRIAKLKKEAFASMDTEEYRALQVELTKLLEPDTPEAKQQQAELDAKLNEYKALRAEYAKLSDHTTPEAKQLQQSLDEKLAEYKSLLSTYSESLHSKTPETKQKQQEIQAKLNAYEQRYKEAKNKWIETKSGQLDTELDEFISSVEQQMYASAYANHASEIAIKKEEIASKKKALTKDVNDPKLAPEVARLKKQWKDLEAKARTAEEVNDRDSAIKLDNQALDAKERYETAKRSWIASQVANLDQELINYIQQLELNDKAVANFNANLPDGANVADSIENIRVYIRETYERLLAAENERFKQELDAVQHGTSSIDVEGIKKTIEQQEEADKQDAIKSVTKNGLIMTDVQLMAQKYRAAAEDKEKQINALKTEIDNLKRSLEDIRKRTQVEDDDVTARRASIKNGASTNKPKVPSTTTTTSQHALAMMPVGSGETAMMAIGGAGIEINTAALVEDLSSSNLARETTLRGVYELLNGGSPKGGWDGTNGAITQPKGNTSGHAAGASVADITQHGADKVFATSVSKIIKQLSGRKTREAMAFIGAEGHIGKLIEGTKDNIPGDRIASSLAAEVKKVFAMIHNHPSKISGLSDVDLDSAVKYAYGNKPVKVHGTVANGLLTSVNFDGIDKTTANAILGEYNKSLMQLTKDKANLFGINKDGRFAIKDVRDNPALQKDVSDALYTALKNAFAAFGYGDAVKQVSIDDLGAWRDSIVKQTIDPVPTQTATQAVEETVSSNPVNVPVKPVVTGSTEQTGFDAAGKVSGVIDNITMLSNSAGLDLGRLTQALNLVNNHPILSDRSAYADRHAEVMPKIINTLSHAINLPDFGMIDKDDANVIVRLRDYLVSLGKQEEEITGEMQKQNQLAAEGAQQAAKAAEATESQAVAEQKVTEKKKEAKTADSSKKPSVDKPSGGGSGSGGNSNGGETLKGLNALAQEITLRAILAALNAGIKINSDDEKSANKDKSGGKKSSKEDRLSEAIGIGEAERRLQQHVKTNYPYISQNATSVRETMLGYSMDISRPKDMQGIVAAQEKIKQLEAEINEYIANGQEETTGCIKAKNDLAETQARYKGLLKETEQITISINRKGDSISEVASFKNLAVGAKAANKELQNFENIVSSIHESGSLFINADGDLSSSNSKIHDYLSEVKSLNNYKSGLTSEQLFNPAIQQDLSERALKVQNLRKEVTALLNAINQYNAGESKGILSGIFEDSSDSDIKRVMQDAVSANSDMIESFGDLTPVMKNGQVVSYQLGYTLRTGKREVQNMTASLNPLTHELTIQNGAVKEVATGWDKFWAGLKGKFASIIQYIASITSIHDMIRYIREGVQHVRDIDSALGELKKVTDETDASYASFLQDMSKTGSVIGATVKDLTTMAAD
jgi:hypothetical protein